MASKTKRGFLYYLLWVAFIGFGIVCLFASVLLFNPGKDVYGIGLRYISHRGAENVNVYDENNTTFNSLSFDKVVFNSKYSDFSLVKTAEYTQITFGIDKKVNGFSNDENYKGCYLEFNCENNTLNVNVVEPEFWFALAKSIKVVMYYPINYDFSNKTFEFNTDEGQIELPGKTSAGELEIYGLNINSGSGKILTYKELIVNSGIVNITTEKSETYLYNNIGNTLNFKSNNGRLVIEKISGNLTIDTQNLSAKCGTIGGNVSYACKTGYIMINKLLGNFTAIIDKMHIADVVIDEIQGNATIPTAESSNITIKKITGEALIDTTSGYVKIEEAHNNVTIKTKNGSVNLTQVGLNTKNDIQTENGVVNANFKDIRNVYIETIKGAINVNVATDLSYKFIYETQNSVTVSWIKEKIEKAGTILIGGASENSINTLRAISTNGKITLKDGFKA